MINIKSSDVLVAMSSNPHETALENVSAISSFLNKPMQNSCMPQAILVRFNLFLFSSALYILYYFLYHSILAHDYYNLFLLLLAILRLYYSYQIITPYLTLIKYLYNAYNCFVFLYYIPIGWVCQ